MIAQGGPIIVFDALCPLCSANAQFILRHDRRGHFRLTSMQSETGKSLYWRFGLDPDDPDTLIVVDGDRLSRDSDAIILIWRNLDWPWRLAAIASGVPRFVRDPLYRWVARNRYRLFGRRQSCWLPTTDLAERML
jgi:predicted DCC family thiol-disulfide oxidoreductase YuxK